MAKNCTEFRDKACRGVDPASYSGSRDEDLNEKGDEIDGD